MAAVSRSRPKVWLLAGLPVLLAVAAVATARLVDSGPAHAAIDPEGEIYQAGAVAGRAAGVSISRADASIVVFEKISDAGRFDYSDEFQYSGHVLKIARIRLVDYSLAVAPERPSRTLLQAEARIQRRGELVRLDKPRTP
jgi:hypothetical protein